MKVTFEILEEIIAKALKISGSKTKQSLCTFAINEIINKDRRNKLLSFKGKINLDLDLDALRERKSQF